jgi:hypothetical protein
MSRPVLWPGSSVADAQFFGMPLKGVNDDIQVISAVLVVKMFEGESETGVAYQTCATDGLTTVEALGMIEFAGVKIRHDMNKHL